MLKETRNKFRRLDALLQAPSSRVRRLPLSRRYAILSDVHLGNGGLADNFHRNEQTLVHALRHYRKQGYYLILLGDIEELWQFDLDKIRARYGATVYKHLRAFPRRRLYRVFGNHDYDWEAPLDPARPARRNHLGRAVEALKLGRHILLTHGHQADPHESRGHWWYRRLAVRLFKIIEPLVVRLFGFQNESAAQSQRPRDYERKLYQWAKANQTMLICGHTHRAIFASLSYAERLHMEIAKLEEQMNATADKKLLVDLAVQLAALQEKLEREKQRKGIIVPVETAGKALPAYFNSGCALYNDGLTNLEIAEGKIRLVKWQRAGHAVIAPEVYQEGDLKEFLKEATGRIIPRAAFLQPRREPLHRKIHRISKAFATH